MEQKQLIAVLAVVIVIAAAGIGAFFLMGGGGASETKYTVTYNSNGGTEIASKEFTQNSETFNLTEPTRDGYNFLGWFENSDLSGSAITQIIKGTAKNISVYAKWQLILANNTTPSAAQVTANTDVKVTFDNGATASDKSIDNTILDELSSGKTLTIEDTVNNISWTFAGAESMNTDYETSNTELDTSVSVTAEPTEITKQATLSFNHSGKLPYPSTVKYLFGIGFAGQEVTIKNNSTSEILGPFTVDTEGYVEFQIDHCSVWTITVSYDVTFNANGGLIDGQSTKVIKVAYNTQVGTLPVATRTGYDAYVWDPAADPTDVITAAKTYTAQWTANSYTVAFNGNGSTSGSVVNIDATYDAQSSMPANGFTKTGYTFAGWNTASDGSGTAYQPQAQFSNLTSTNGDTVTIYAQWTANSYTVAFNGNGSTSGSVDSINATYGVVIIIPPNGFAKTGHSFAGWNTASDGSGDPYQIAAEVSNLTSENGATFTLYAQWTPITYAMHFNKVSDGATGTMDNQVITYGTHPQINACAFTSNTEAFNGWALTQGGDIAFANQASLTEDLASVQDAVVELYAVWGPYNIAANITLDENAYTGLTVTAQKGSDNPFPLIYENGSYVCRQGILDETTYKVLIGGVDTGATIVTENGTGSVNIAYFTVTFDLNGGTPAVQPVIVKSGQTVAEPQNISKTGYDLSGWKKGNADWNFSTAIAETTTLTAQWTPQTYTVTLNPVGGAIVSGNVTQYTYGVGATLPAEMARPAYTFGGWYVNQNYSGDAVTSIGTADTGEKTFYAKWNPVTYTLTFDSLGGSPENPITYTVEDTPLNLPANTTKTGYSLMGWYEQAAPETVMTQLDQGTYGNKTLYAKWAANAYQVVFDKNSQTATGEMAPQNFLYGADPVALTANAYSNTGYAMSGWATSADGAKVYNDGAQVQNLTAENNGTVTLYAVWEAYYIQVTVKVNDALDTRELTVKAMHNAMEYPMERISTGVYKVSSTPNASIQDTGYSIYIGNDAVTSTTVTQGKAEVEVNYYTVTFYTGCEVQVPTQTILSGGYAQEPQNVVRTGYDLSCWSQDSSQEVPFEFENTTIGAARILDAFWNAKHYTVVYDSNEGSGAAMNNGEAVFGQEFTPAACTYTKTVQGVEWRFAGWNTVSDGSGTIFRAGQATVIDADAIAHLDNSGRIILYALWRDTNYIAAVGDTFSGTTSYTEPNQPAVNETFRSMVIGTGNDEYRMESNFYFSETWYFNDLTAHENGEWPVFGNLFDVAELASILSGQGQADTQQINGQTVQVTKYEFTYLEGHATGFLMTVDETGMICRIYMELNVTSQMAQEMPWSVGTYTEDVLVSGYTPAAQAETHTVSYAFDQFSERTEERSSTTFVTPESLGFTRDDKVFVKWVVIGDNDVFYYPGDRILTDKNVYAIWETPNTNVNWYVTNLPDGLNILLNDTSDAWISNAELGDYLSFDGTSNWQAAGNGYDYRFTFGNNNYLVRIATISIEGQSTYETISHQLVNGTLHINFISKSPLEKFYVGITIDQVMPEMKGYLPHVDDYFVYTSRGIDITYTVTKIPGSQDWLFKDYYEINQHVAQQQDSLHNTAMYSHIVGNSSVGLYTIEDYGFGNNQISCYHIVNTLIEQGSGQRSVSTTLEEYIGINDGLVYRLVSQYENIVLKEKSNFTAISKHAVTFDGNGGEVENGDFVTVNVFGTQEVSAYREDYELVGWSTVRNGDVVYGLADYIDQDVTLYAVWRFDGALFVVDPGQCTMSGPTNFVLSTNATVYYPDQFDASNNGQPASFMTITGFTENGMENYQFRYLSVMYTSASISQNSFTCVAPHVWVNTASWDYYKTSFPESATFVVERGYSLNVTLIAGNATTVTYDPHGATGDAIVRAEPRNGVIVLPATDTFSRPGYSFKWWSTYENGILGLESGMCPSTVMGAIDNGETLTIYAIWEPRVSIVYDAKGGSGNYDSDTDSFVIAAQSHYYTRDDYSKNGMALLGWSLSSNANIVDYLPESEISFTVENAGDTVRLYAVWAYSDDLFQVSFSDPANRHGTQWDAPGYVTLAPNIGMTLPAVTSNGNYRLIGWALDAEHLEQNIPVGETFILDVNPGDFSLIAVWAGFTVQFNGNEGTGSMDSIEIVYNTPTQLPSNAFTRDGYEFNGWTSDLGQFEGRVELEDGQWWIYVIDKSVATVNVQATWIQMHTVTFVLGDGAFEDFDNPQQVRDGTILNVPDPSNEGFNFGGWFLENGTEFMFGNPITSNVTVYAKWVFDLTLKTYNDQIDDWDEVLYEGITNPVELAEFDSPAGYYSSWNTSGDGTGTHYAPGQSVNVIPDGGYLTLFKVCVGYNVTFHFVCECDPEEIPEDMVIYYGTDDRYLPDYVDGHEVDYWIGANDVHYATNEDMCAVFFTDVPTQNQTLNLMPHYAD